MVDETHQEDGVTSATDNTQMDTKFAMNVETTSKLFMN